MPLLTRPPMSEARERHTVPRGSYEDSTRIQFPPMIFSRSVAVKPAFTSASWIRCMRVMVFNSGMATWVGVLSKPSTPSLPIDSHHAR